jgi:HSP90 family molecular chaperone
VLSIISKRLVRKALDMFAEMQQDEAKAARFNSNFGRYIKVGVIEDRDNKDALLKLASFASTEGSDDKTTTLPQYVERMKEGQKQIYYVSGASRAAAASSPVLEGLRKKGYEVLIALDQIDEIALQGIGRFGDFEVVDAAKEGTDLGEQSEEEKASVQAAKESLVETCKAVKAVLGSKVDKVEVSTRLTASPSALVQPQWGMSPQMQRFMKAQAAATGDDMGMMGGMAANLELNPSHPAVLKLKRMVDEDKTSAAMQDYATLLYDVAAVSSGYEVADPAAFASRVVRLMTGDEPAAVVTDPAPEVAPEVAAEPAAEAATAAPSDTSSKDESDKPITPEVM